MEAVVDVGLEQELQNLILSEVDLQYHKKQNVLLSCSSDGCSRISYCSCDCNDGSGTW